MLHYFIVLNTMKSHLLECVVMQNYKVEVKNHGEGMEAQDLFLEIGFKKSTLLEDGYPKYVVADQVSLTGGKESGGAHISFAGTDYKKITMPELRDMVTQNQKEYLVKTDTGYTLQVLSDVVDGHDGIIEVPDGAMAYWECDRTSIKFFSKLEEGCHFYHYLNKNSEWVLWGDADFKIFEMKWQREELNDQVASAEEYRKSFSGIPKATLDAMNNIQNAFDKAQCAINAQNAMAKLFTYPQYLSGVAHGKEFIVKPNQKKDESKLFDTGKFILEYFTQPEELPFVSDNAWNTQIGGDHYKKLAIQPMEYALQNKLDYAQANVVKYVTRHADKNGKQDLLKAIHNIELMIAHYYSDQE